MAHLQSMRAQPDTQREYETIFIVSPEADSEQIRQINDRIRKVVEEDDGKLLRVENWGKRKLAYEIKTFSRGIYLYWRYLSNPHLVGEVERNLRLLDPVIRYLTVKVDQDVDPEVRPTDVTDESLAAAAETVPDEEDLAIGRDRSASAAVEEAETETMGAAPSTADDAEQSQEAGADAQVADGQEQAAEIPAPAAASDDETDRDESNK